MRIKWRKKHIVKLQGGGYDLDSSNPEHEQKIRDLISVATLNALEFTRPDFDSREQVVFYYLSILIEEIPIEVLARISQQAIESATNKLKEISTLEQSFSIPNDNENNENKGE